jgi:hypothetical protein
MDHYQGHHDRIHSAYTMPQPMASDRLAFLLGNQPYIPILFHLASQVVGADSKLTI